MQKKSLLTKESTIYSQPIRAENQFKTMATLKELIANGLQVGQLVENPRSEGEEGFFYSIWQFNGNDFVCVKSCDWACDEGCSNGIPFPTSKMWMITTAYNSGIDPDLLPVPEPFATGWVVTQYGYKFEPIPYEKPSNLFTDGWHRDFLKSDCRPCLPPL